jgi:hypothetical protein
MKTVKYNLRNLLLVLVAALFSATALTSAGAQQCPNPRQINLTQATGAATPVLADFPTTPCSAGFEPNFGGTKIDRCFRHTFSFAPPNELCCQCIDGKSNTLTIRYKALLGGPAGSPTSANDTFAIYSNGSVVSGTSQALYSGAVTTGQVVTKTIPLKCSWLTNNRVSFLFQDESALQSATLKISTCCVKK